MNNYNIDSHKLNWHPDRVAQWLNAKDDWQKAKRIYPIYVELSPSGFCNHRCVFCALDYLNYKTGMIDVEILKKTIGDMAKGGVKSIMFGGEGESLLHPRIAELINFTKEQRIDVSLTTNGIFLSEELIKKIISNISWLKISIDAGTAETYAKIHGTKKEDFKKLLKNIELLVKIKNTKNNSCVIGTQMLLLPENYKETQILARKVKQAGVNYLVIKPYSQHLKSITRQYENLSYKNFIGLEKKLEKFNDHNFDLIFRAKTMEKKEKPKVYNTCLAVPFFWTYIMANGDVYGCSCYLGDENFYLGNIYKKPFKEIWEGKEREKLWHFIKKNLDISTCRKNCRMDEVNNYLWQMKNPPEHVNFI